MSQKQETAYLTMLCDDKIEKNITTDGYKDASAGD
jgi:hypothetical protein